MVMVVYDVALKFPTLILITHEEQCLLRPFCLIGRCRVFVIGIMMVILSIQQATATVMVLRIPTAAGLMTVRMLMS